MSVQRLIVYHGNCIDGFTAAWACWKRYGDDAEYFPAQYGSGGADVELPDVVGRDVVMVDFCTGREQLLRLFEQAKTFQVYDHHKTAEAACRGLSFCTFDMNRSGAGLVWDCLLPGVEIWSTPLEDQRPWLVKYVEDRDLWRWALPRSKEVSAYISAQEQTFARWDEMAFTETPEQAALKGEGVLGYIDRYVSEMSKQARRTCFAGFENVPIVNAPYINTSELVGHLAESAEFAVGWFQRADGMYQYSLRSRGNFDVSALAKQFGGGGHKNAAGFALNAPPDMLRERPPATL